MNQQAYSRLESRADFEAFQAKANDRWARIWDGPSTS